MVLLEHLHEAWPEGVEFWHTKDIVSTLVDRFPDMWGITMLDQLVCRIQLRRLNYEGRFTPPSVEGTVTHPGSFGVFNWGGVAVDPARQVTFAMPVYLAFTSTLIPRPDTLEEVVSDLPRGATTKSVRGAAVPAGQSRARAGRTSRGTKGQQA